MNIREEEIRDDNGELKMYRLVVEDITKEDLINFLKFPSL